MHVAFTKLYKYIVNIPPISVVGKKRTLRICSLLCSHLSLEAPEERKHTWAIFQNIEPSSSSFSFLYFDGALVSLLPVLTDWLDWLWLLVQSPIQLLPPPLSWLPKSLERKQLRRPLFFIPSLLKWLQIEVALAFSLFLVILPLIKYQVIMPFE